MKNCLLAIIVLLVLHSSSYARCCNKRFVVRKYFKRSCPVVIQHTNSQPLVVPFRHTQPTINHDLLNLLKNVEESNTAPITVTWF
jgi:hypothetical protein